MFCIKVMTLLCIALTTAASLVSLLTHYWIKHDSTPVHHQGLYKFCNDEDIGCQEFDEDPILKIDGMPDWHLGVLGLVIVAVMMHVIALLCFLFVCVQDQFTGCHVIVVIILAISWISISAAMGVYTQKFYKIVNDIDTYSWGYSFILGWVSFIFNLISAILAFVFTMVRNNRNRYGKE